MTENVSLWEIPPHGYEAQKIVKWLSDEEVNRFLEVRFRPPTVIDQKKQIASWYFNPDILYLGIYITKENQSKEFIGTLKFGPYNQNHGIGEIGLVIGESNYWGKGIASIAIKNAEAIIREAFPGIRKITAGAYLENVGSIRAFEKNGFEIEGILKRHVACGNQRLAVVVLGKLLDCN